MRNNEMITWPYTAVVTHDGKPLAEYRCSTLESLLTHMRPYLEMPGVTAVITTQAEPAGKESGDVRS
jgi:hypothetical protein